MTLPPPEKRSSLGSKKHPRIVQNDHLGTPQKMTDQAVNTVWSADYLPFGKASVTLGTVENNLRFAGQYYDSETGLHYNHHRYYDPKLGRYLRAEPLKISDRIIQARAYAASFSMLDGSGFENLVVYSSLIGSGVLLNSQLQNLFSYATNNPINSFDPDGQYVQAIIVVGGGVIVGGAILHHYMQQRRPKGPTPPYIDNKRKFKKYNQPNPPADAGVREPPPPPPPDNCFKGCNDKFCNPYFRLICYLGCLLAGGDDNPSN